MWPNPPHRLHRISFIGGARESGNAQSFAQWPKFPHLLHLSLEDGPLAYPPPPPSLSYPAAPPRLLSGQSRALFYRKNHTKYTGEKSWGEKKISKGQYRNTRSRRLQKSLSSARSRCSHQEVFVEIDDKKTPPSRKMMIMKKKN